MEKPLIHIAKNISFIPLLLLLQFASLFFISFSYEPPNKYFINCGSDKVVTYGGRTFTGDETFTKQGSSVTSQALLSNTSELYHTARNFTQQSSYAFETDSLNAIVYLVRLHFLAFGSQAHLGEAVFDVSATSGALLLHNFNAGNATDTPLVKEFYVTANTSKFRLYFTPRNSSFAFVNAIEFFPAPLVNFDPGQAYKVGNNFVASSVLETVYRINVGGEKVEPIDDQIWRTWVTDDEFLITKENAKESRVGVPTYPSESEDSTFSAPVRVYNTAKEMNFNTTSDNSSNLQFNITWGFEVNKSASHIVRAHFCDVISDSLNTLSFNLYINGDFRQEIDLYNFTHQHSLALYFDFAVGSQGSGDLNISIGPSNESMNNNAFLNGLEIWEVKAGVASLPIEKESESKPNLPIIIGAVSGGLALVFALVAGFFVLVAKRRKTKPVEHSSWGQVPGFGGGSTHSRITEATINGSPVPHLHLGLKLSLSEILLATKNFNPKLVIGKGGFGIVYRGTLMDGTLVAVKRSAPGSGQGLFEFETEITILSKIRHRHLVSLIGYCDERSEMILVYEFMEKGTLRDHLYGSTKLPRLSWKQRLEICIGSASGLEYLHKGSSSGIIHRDVKSTNILLDENYVAKVADFGLSKSNPGLEDTPVSTKVKGTFGYLDPDYFRTNQLTEKSDVYSFGVVLLEILCARPAIDTALPREEMNLAEWAIKCKAKGLIEEIVDPTIRGQINPNSLRRFADTAEKCLREDGAERPAMSDVKWDLEYALQLQKMPLLREAHEDSTATASGFSSTAILPDVRRLPSLESVVDDSGVVMSRDFSEVTGGSDVFSQLKTDGAR